MVEKSKSKHVYIAGLFNVIVVLSRALTKYFGAVFRS